MPAGTRGRASTVMVGAHFSWTMAREVEHGWSLAWHINKKHLQDPRVLQVFLKKNVYSHWESNPDQRFRKPPFYPLNYESIPRLVVVCRPEKTVLCNCAAGMNKSLKRQQFLVACAKLMEKIGLPKHLLCYYATILLKCVNCFGSLGRMP